MKDLKICVYAICKNESKFVDRFMDAVSEADAVYILDTGSSDNTAELFRKRGAIVHETNYEHFEFDRARNDSLSYVPEDFDVCFCLDIDDVIEPGFTKYIREDWKDNTKQMGYDYILAYDENNKPTSILRNNHIHARKDYHWRYPIHEVLHYDGTDYHKVESNRIRVWHKPDSTKSRSFYLGMLEDYVEKNPTNARNRYLLTRSYYNNKKYFECITSGHKYLELPDKDNNFKSKVMRHMAQSYNALGMYEESVLWAKKSIDIFPETRDGYTFLVRIYYRHNEFKECIKYGKLALKIKDYNKTYTNDIASWDGTIYDYISLAYSSLRDYKNAIKYVDMDLKMHPTNARLLENRKIFVKRLEQQENNKTNA